MLSNTCTKCGGRRGNLSKKQLIRAWRYLNLFVLFLAQLSCRLESSFGSSVMKMISVFQVDAGGRIVVLENGGVPWKEHFFQLEEEKGLLNAKMTYMLFGGD